MRQVVVLVVLSIVVSGCVTEGGPANDSAKSKPSPVEVAHQNIDQRIAKMRHEFGKELLATVQYLISRHELARDPIVRALLTAEPRTRAALVYVLGFIPGAESHKAVLGYLRDQDEPTRYEAAAALLQLGDWSAVPILISFMESDDRRIRFKAHQALSSVTQTELEFPFNGSAPERETAISRWKSWWESRRNELIYESRS